MKKIWQFLKEILLTIPRKTSKILEIRIIYKEEIKSKSRDHSLKVKQSK